MTLVIDGKGGTPFRISQRLLPWDFTVRGEAGLDSQDGPDKWEFAAEEQHGFQGWKTTQRKQWVGGFWLTISGTLLGHKNDCPYFPKQALSGA